MKSLRLFLFVFFVINNLLGQSLPVTSESIISKFLSSGTEFQWDFPISEKEYIPITWREKQSSFYAKGIRTFVGYVKGDFQAVISINGRNLSGGVLFNGKEYQLYTDAQGYLSLKTSEKPHYCPNCEGMYQPKPLRFESGISESVPQVEGFSVQQRTALTDNVLRVYRLAMPVTYEYFTTAFQSDVQQVHNFWAQMEMALNEIYTRDISVKFEIVQDDRLIIQTDKDPINKAIYKRSASEIIKNATENINGIIDQKDYDIGIVIGKNDQLTESPYGDYGLLGLAGVGSAYTHSYKAQAIAVNKFLTIAHEMGHLFGANHTHNGIKTEVGQGQSLMSYGEPMNFFSLPSIAGSEQIKPILARMPYYSDIQRKKMQKFPFYHNGYIYSNAPYGITTLNQAPVLDKDAIKTEYTIPQNTFFQFYLSATDTDNHQLHYMAHPADIRTQQVSNAHFLTFAPSIKNNIVFQTQYQRSSSNFVDTELYTPMEYSTPQKTGTFTFWLGVRDSDLTNAGRNSHATAYDVAETKVKIVSGTPFKLTNSFDKKYKARDKISLKWNVDANVFPSTSKVRILLSDDFGETFSHVLMHSTENDGECEIVLPDISIGTKKMFFPYSLISTEVPAGVIKVEVIDHLAYDVSATRPFSVKINRRGVPNITPLGGFVLEESPIKLTNTPLQEVTIPCSKINDIPQGIQAKSTCQGPLKMKYSEEDRLATCQKHSYWRIWTFTDDCGNQTSFRQRVHVEPSSIKLSHLPAPRITIPCAEVDNIPQGIIAQSECAGGVTQTYTEEGKQPNCQRYTYTRVWTFTDACGNKIGFRQEVNVEPAPISLEVLPNAEVSLFCTDLNNIPEIKPHSECANITIKYQEEGRRKDCQRYTYTRIWTLTDACNNQKQIRQIVHVIPKLKLGKNLPQNQVVSCHNIPTAPTSLEVVGGCGQEIVQFTENKEKESCDTAYRIFRTWVVTDECNQEVVHNQTISVVPELVVYNFVRKDTDNYFRISGITIKSITIFDVMGIKVFQTDNYGENGEVFTGVSNTQGVISSSAKLPSGTYFYTMEYLQNGIINHKTGYLYLK